MAMKKWFIVIVIFSLILNGFFTFLHLQQKRFETPRIGYNQEGDTVTINVSIEKQKFFKELKQLHPETSSKKLLFMTIYSTSAGGMDQIPILDTIIKPLREDMAYLLVSIGSQKETTNDLRYRGINYTNFISLHDADTFANALCREVNRKPLYLWNTYKYIPMNVIFDSTGKILYVDTAQAFSSFKMDTLIDRKHALSLKNAVRTIK